MEIMRVATKSNPNAVAGALANIIRKGGAAEMHIIGAGALNQAVKAVAIARGFMAPSGVDLIMRPAFADITLPEGDRTMMRLIVEPKDPIRGQLSEAAASAVA